MMLNEIPLLSVCIITYNQQDYIKQCIDGALMQNVDFDYEIVIGDDNSKDDTLKICQQFADSYPGKIRLIARPHNLGMIGNWVETIKACKGKYIAICEGDDYWTDSSKLQKQTDFLEANPDYAICFHRVYELEKDKAPELSNLNTSLSEETYTIEDLAKGNFIHTPSVVFRNGLVKEFPEWYKDAPIADYILHMLNAKEGKIKYLPESMAVYRSNAGIWSTQNMQYKLIKWMQVLEFLIEDFDKPEVYEGLTDQYSNILISLKNQNDQLFLSKKYLLYGKLIHRLNEKDAQLSELKKNYSVLAKSVSAENLLKALAKKLLRKIKLS